jgi:hypothetical protein
MFDTYWAVSGKDGDPPISRAMMRMIGRAFSVDDAAARSELGYVGGVSRSDGLRSYEAYRPHADQLSYSFS